MSMVRREPLTGGRLAGLGGLGDFNATSILNTVNAPGVWLCDKAAQNDLNICGSEGVGRYMPYVFSLLVYGTGLVLVLKIARRGR